MKKRRVDLGSKGTLLGDTDDGQETCVPSERLAGLRGDGSQYSESLKEACERQPWTPEAWDRLDAICGKSMPDDVKRKLATDVSDFVDGNFFNHALPLTRAATLETMETVAKQCRDLVDLLHNDHDVRSLRGVSFADGLATRLMHLGRSAHAVASVKSEEVKVDRSRGNTVQQSLLLDRLTKYFQASGAPLSRTIEEGNPKGVFAEYLHLIWTLLPDDKVPDQAETFIRRGYDVARKLLANDKADKHDGRHR